MGFRLCRHKPEHTLKLLLFFPSQRAKSRYSASWSSLISALHLLMLSCHVCPHWPESKQSNLTSLSESCISLQSQHINSSMPTFSSLSISEVKHKPAQLSYCSPRVENYHMLTVVILISANKNVNYVAAKSKIPRGKPPHLILRQNQIIAITILKITTLYNVNFSVSNKNSLNAW